MTIDYVVKKKAIDLHLQGRGRNEIARILNSQKMKISEATITHLIQDWKRHQQQAQAHDNLKASTINPGTSQPPSPLQLPQASPQSSQTLELQVCPELPSFASASASISTAIDMNNVGSPVLTASGRPGVGQANNVNSNETITHANGGPLYFLSNDTDTTINCREENVVLGSNNSFSSNPYPDPDQRESKLSSLSPNPSFELSHTSTKELNHASKTETSSSIKVEDPEAQIDIGDVDYHPYRHLHTQTPEAEERIESKCQPSAPDPEDNKPSIEIDWDSDETWQRRLFRTIMDERRRREEEEERRIQHLRQELEEERQNLAQIMYNIDQQKKALEVKLFEVEDLIPSPKYLKDIGIGFDQAIVWIDCIKEKAEIERIDLRTATWKLAQDLRAYRDLGSLSKAIQDATQQLAMLNMVNEQQKRAIATLVDLQKAGFSEKEIAELIALINLWNKSGIVQIGGPGFSQGNGSGSNGSKSKLDDKLIGHHT